MMNGVDFDWTDAGSPEDHADKLEAISEYVGNRGRYRQATELHVAAQCIRYLDAKVEVLKKENDAAEGENEALREALDKLRVWVLDNHTVPSDIVADVEYALVKEVTSDGDL